MSTEQTIEPVLERISAIGQGIETRLTSLEQSIDARLTRVESELSDLKSEVSAVKNDVRKLVRRIEVVSSDMVELRAGLRFVEDRLDKIEVNPS